VISQMPAGGPAKPPAAAVTWRFSVEQADRLAPGGAVQPLLALAALLDGHGIPATVFSTQAATDYLAASSTGGRAGTADRSRDALLVLERTGLLDIDTSATPPMIRMSAVIQDAVQAATPAPMRDRAVRVAADALLAAWPREEQDPWLADSLRCCAASLQQGGGKLLMAGGCHPLLLRAGQSLDLARLSGPALTYWQALATACETTLGPAHPDSQLIDERLADAYLAAGRPGEAVSWFERVQANRVKMLGPDHPDTLARCLSLATAYYTVGRLTDAQSLLRETLARCERVLPPGDRLTQVVRESLTNVAGASGQPG
jgi:Tetratricopeptide repeat